MSVRVFFRRVAELRLEWTFPKRVDVLILFTTSADLLATYFTQKRVATLDPITPKRNIWILLLAALKGSFDITGYLTAAIALTRPALVLSLQDNFEPLWRIRTTTKVALIQNGLRVDDPTSTPNVEENGKHRGAVDYYFCFNSLTEQHMTRVLEARYIPIGSFRNNHQPRLSTASTNRIAYISTFRSDLSPSHQIAVGDGRESVSYESILGLRARIVLLVQEFCMKYGLELEIVGKDRDHLSELAFYKSHLKQSRFEFTPRKPKTFQYCRTDAARLVVSTGSTLGLESLARGNRTGIFDPMSYILKNDSYRFGWPAVLGSEGPFWSTEASPLRIEEVLGTLLNISDERWGEMLWEYRGVLPIFDSGNKIFIDQLSQFGAESPNPPTN